MAKLRSFLICLSAVFLFGNALAGEERLDTVKAELSSADCVFFEFLSILESDIFETVDTTVGTAYVAKSGRYHITLGDDWYVHDGHSVYSYSQPNNQVVIEPIPPEEAMNAEVSFLTRLDDFYETKAVTSDSTYSLRLIKDPSSMPDSLELCVAGNPARIAWLAYLDINGEPNRIVLTRQETNSSCDTSQFHPVIPDSVDVTELW
jgi:hypothetical protein